jgi:phosphatidylglycerophosphatase A
MIPIIFSLVVILSNPGIIEPCITHGIQGADVLKLFDHMAHRYVLILNLYCLVSTHCTQSSNKSMGLGDKGKLGIDEFLAQHRCNIICQKLGLSKGLLPGFTICLLFLLLSCVNSC